MNITKDKLEVWVDAHIGMDLISAFVKFKRDFNIESPMADKIWIKAFSDEQKIKLYDNSGRD